MGKNLPNSIRKHIRLEKARIRRGVLDTKEQEHLIQEMHVKYFDQKSNQVALVENAK